MAKYNVRIGLKDKTVMDVEKYNLSKKEFNGADGKVYTMDDINYFIVTKEEFEKLTKKPSAKKSTKKVTETEE